MRINCTTFAVPSKLRFENKNLKLINSSKLDTGINHFVLVPSKLRFENQKCRKSKKQALCFACFFDLFVTLKGFKPPTAGAEIQCSIQLSYRANLFKIILLLQYWKLFFHQPFLPIVGLQYP